MVANDVVKGIVGKSVELVEIGKVGKVVELLNSDGTKGVKVAVKNEDGSESLYIFADKVKDIKDLVCANYENTLHKVSLVE